MSRVLLLLAAFSTATTIARGQAVHIWDGSSSTAWATGSNWDVNAAPGSGDIARFNASTNRDPAIAGTSGSPTQIGQLDFALGADAESFSGNSTYLRINGVGGVGLTHASAVTNTFAPFVVLGGSQSWTTSGADSNLTFNNDLDLVGHALTINAGAGTTITTGGGDSINSTGGGGSLIKDGTGTLTLGNAAGNYAGGTTLNAGTISIGNNASLGTGTITLAGGTLTAGSDRTLANELELTANSTISGSSGRDFVFSSGFIAGTGGTLSLDNTSDSGTMSVGFSGSGFDFSRPIDFADAFVQLRALPASGTQTFSGVISGSGIVRVDGAGGTAVLSGANTFSGGVQLDAGTLSLGHASALGTGELNLGNAILTAGADLTLANDFLISTATSTVSAADGVDLVFSGALAGGAGDILNLVNSSGTGSMSVGFSSDSLSYNRDIVLGANTELRLANTGGTQTFSGTISGSGDVRQDGAGGTVLLAKRNSYTGVTRVDAGTLKLGVDDDGTNSALGSAAAGTIISSGAALDLNGFSLANAEAITLAGSGIGGTGALLNTGAAASLGGSVTLSGATSLGGTGNITLEGDLIGNFTLTKVGAATLTFAGLVDGTTGTVGATALTAGSMIIGNGSQTTTLNTGAFSSLAGTTLTIATGGTVVADYAAGSTTFSGALAGTGTFEKAGAGTLVFDQSFDASGLTLRLSGGTLSLLAGVDVNFDRIHITGDTILDFNGSGAASTFLTSAKLQIESGVTVTINSWYSVANNAALSTVWKVTSQVNGGVLGGTDLGETPGAPLSQIDFTGASGLNTTWVSGDHNGWFDHEIRPTPEPATYGALLLSSALALLGWRRWRRS